MKVSALVMAREGSRLRVRVERSGGCGRCHEPGGCGGHKTSHLFGAPQTEYLVDAPDDIVVGERVELFAPEGVLLRAAMLAYGLPLLGLLLGAALGTWVQSGSDGVVIILGAGGFLAALMGSRRARQVSASHGIQVRRAMSAPCDVGDDSHA